MTAEIIAINREYSGRTRGWENGTESLFISLLISASLFLGFCAYYSGQQGGQVNHHGESSIHDVTKEMKEKWAPVKGNIIDSRILEMDKEAPFIGTGGR